MIRIRDLSVAYPTGEWVLKDINLTIEPGECILVCGASGCGKTTLTRAVNGLIPHFEPGRRAGRVEIHGRDVSDYAPHELAAVTGSLFQDPRSQFFTTRVTDELVWGCETLKFDRDTIRRRLDRSLSLFGLDGLKHRTVFELSCGQQQQTLFGAIHAMGPGIVILDEPSANLDPDAVDQLGRHLRRLKQAGKTILVAEHRLHYLAGLADRIVIMDRGRIQEIFTREALSDLAPEDLSNRGLRQLDPGRICPGSNVRPGNAGACLALENLGFAYTKKARPVIRDLDLCLNSGEILGLCGANGAGKTTLIRIASGLIRETSGRVCLDGRPLKRADRIRHCHLLLQQAGHQLFRPSVRVELADMGNEDAAGEVVRALGLDTLYHRHPQSLSGGQKQRLALACALIRSPGFLFLDEPTSGMDAGFMTKLALVLKKIAARGQGIMVVTHDIEFLTLACTRVATLAAGRITLT